MTPALVFCFFALVATHVAHVSGFAPSGRRMALKPLQENFFIDLPTLNDPSKITPKLLNGEETYKNFVDSYDPNSLLTGGGGGGGGSYNAIRRIRELKLLSATVDSGLLQALEDKGVTLTQLERLLPIVDNAGVLPLIVKNKGLIVSALPLLLEPAPVLLPLVVSFLKTSPSTFTSVAAALVALGGYEGVAEGNVLLAALLVVLSAPLGIAGTLLGVLSTPLPAVSTSIISNAAPERSSGGKTQSGRPMAKKRVSDRPQAAPARATPQVKTVNLFSAAAGASAPRAKAPQAAAPAGSVNGKRKVIRIN